MAFQIALINVAVLIALSIPGYLLMKTKKLKNTHIQALVVILIYAAQPSMVAKSFLSLKFSAEKGLNILISIGVFVLVMLLVLMCACVVFRKWRKKETFIKNNDETASNNLPAGDNGYASENILLTGAESDSTLRMENLAAGNSPQDKDTAQNTEPVKINTESDKYLKRVKNYEEDNRLYRFASMFGNTGYLGLPLVSVLFPGNAVMLLYTSICIVAFNLLSWTVGVFVITGDKKYVSLKKGLLNPVPIATLITLPFFFMPFTVPKEIVKIFDILGSMTTPISMIIMGARMAQIPLREVFTDYKVYIVCFLRLIIAPLIAFGLLKLFNINNKDLFNTVLIICAMPTAAAAIVFSERFLSDSYTAMKAVLCSSILCIVTIPLFFTLFLLA